MRMKNGLPSMKGNKLEKFQNKIIQLNTITLCRSFQAIKLAANDYFRHRLTTADGRLPVQREMLAGGAAGFCQGKKASIDEIT